MKKLLLLILLICCTGSVFAADRNAQRQAYNSMINSQKFHNEVCQRAVDNFRVDHRLIGYIRSTCLMFQSERQRLIDTVFPSANNVEDEIETYRTIINEYCKYNTYKYVKKDPQVCSPARIERIFAPIQ